MNKCARCHHALEHQYGCLWKCPFCEHWQEVCPNLDVTAAKIPSRTLYNPRFRMFFEIHPARTHARRPAETHPVMSDGMQNERLL